MEVKILTSGSRGNCVYLQSGEIGILVDVGRPKKLLEKIMLDHGIDVTTINGILITHAHGDHIGGISLANKYNIPVYATAGEWQGISGVNDDLRRTVSTLHGKYGMIKLGGLHIYPFKVHHDAYEPVGYTIEDDDGNRCCVVFDTGHVDRDMLEMMEGNIYIVESNYDLDMLQNGPYSDYLKARIISDDCGHLSNDQTAAALKQLISGRGERIYLTHLSRNNNMPALAELTVKKALQSKGLREGTHFFLEVL